MSAPKTQQQQQQPSADDGGANGGAGVVQPRRGPLDPREEKHPVLLLEGNPIRFEPINASTDIGHVIFDEINCNIFVVKRKGRRIRVLSHRETPYTITLERESEIKSLRFSLDSKLLAIRRTIKHLSFVDLDTGRGNEFQQHLKARSPAQLRDFYWTSHQDIVLVTSHGLEMYQVLPKRQQCKLLKSVSLSVSFSMYCHAAKLLVVTSTLSNTVILPFFIKDSTLVRVPKFQVDLPGSSVDAPPRLTNTEISVAVLYGRPYVCVIKNYPKTHVGHKADVTLYHVTTNGCHKAHVLALRENGRFMLNMVDNLVVVHSQPSRASYVFDIRAKPAAAAQRPAARGSVFKQARPTYHTHHPIVAHTRIGAASISRASWQKRDKRDLDHRPIPVNLYSKNWVAFNPDIIIDPSLGALWKLTVSPHALLHHIQDRDALVDILVRRKHGQDVIVNVYRELLSQEGAVNILAIGRVFDVAHRAMQRSTTSGSHGGRIAEVATETSLDVYMQTLVSMREEDRISRRMFVAIILEYIRSLNAHGVCVDHSVYDLLFRAMVEEGLYYQLHQFLQYHVIDDTNYLACRLLSLKDKYQPALQLAMDMFQRLGGSQEQIFDVLLIEKQIVSAMHYLRALGSAVVIQHPGSRLLRAVKDMGDKALYLSAFEFFQGRQRNHGDDFGSGEYKSLHSHYEHLKQQPCRSPSKPLSLS